MRQKDFLFFSSLVIISIIVFFWLIAPLFYSDAFKGSYQMTNPDSLLFARELEQSILKGKVLTSDNYAAFPYDTKTGLAPFYMYFLFTFVNLVFFIFPNLTVDSIYVAAILPVVIPWITTIFLVISIYKLTKDKVLTLFCALGMLPDYVINNVAGYMNLDYDYLINLYIWVWIIGASFYIKTLKDTYVYIGSIVTTLFISTWNGSPFFYFFVTLYTFFVWLKSPKSSSNLVTYSSITMLIGSIVALIFVPRNEDTYRYFFEINVARYSYIQGLLILIASLFLFLLNHIKDYKKPRKIALLTISFLSLFIIIVFHENLLQASGIIFQKDPVHSIIRELCYGISFNKIHNEGIKNLIFGYGLFLFFFPFCFLFDTKFKETKEIRLIQHFLLIFLILTIFYQIRYIRWLGCAYGLLFGFSVCSLYDILFTNLSITNFCHERKQRLTKLLIAIFPFILISLIIKFSNNTIGSQKFIKEEIELFNYIIEYTPKTSGYTDNNNPEYGILSYWDIGNKISFYTKRPVAVSNSLWGYKTMADIFSSETEKEAYELCNKLKIKYIVSEPSRLISNNILSYWKVFKDMPETSEYKLYYGEVPPKDTFDYFYLWLNEHLGLTPLGEFGTSKHFRLVFCNNNDGVTISKYFLFEIVTGALLYFKSEPNSKISISLELKASEMSFIYKINKTTNKDGICQIILPYSNNYKNGNILTESFYKVSIEKENKKILAKLIITDDDVVKGNIIDLNKKLEYLNN